MTQIVVAQRMWQRRDTAAAWTAANPVLAAGEIGVELGAAPADPQKFKIGNGVTPWNTLAYGGGAGGGSVWRDGTGVPSDSLGDDGDYYLRTTTGAVYAKASGAYTVVGNIMGPAGAAGAAGSVWRSGAGVPANSLGVNGDYYLRTSNSDVYFKAAGTYTVVANIKGAPGADSIVPGPAGPPGPSSSCFPTASFDGGSGAIQVGSWCEIYVPFGFEVTRWTLVGEPLGNITIDVRNALYGAYPPLAADSMCGPQAPALAGDIKAQDLDLSDWPTTEVPAGSVLRFHVSACVGVVRATLTLEGVRS